MFDDPHYHVWYTLVATNGYFSFKYYTNKLSPIHEPDTFVACSRLNISFICDGKSLYICNEYYGALNRIWNVSVYQFVALMVRLYIVHIFGVLHCILNEPKLNLIFKNGNIHSRQGNLIFQPWRISCWWTWTLHMKAFHMPWLRNIFKSIFQHFN